MSPKGTPMSPEGMPVSASVGRARTAETRGAAREAGTAGTVGGAGVSGTAGGTGGPSAASDGPRDSGARADCTIDADGRITFRLPSAPATRPHPRLVLRLRPGKGRPEADSRSLDLEAGGPGGHLCALLEPHPALGEGRWDAYLVPGPDAEPQRLRPGLRDLRALVDGHLRDRTSPVAVRVPYATRDGFLALRTWLRTVHAEAGAVDVTDRAITVAVRLHGAALGADALVHLRLRGTGTVRTLRPRADDDGRGFSFTTGTDEAADVGGGADQVWDVFVRPTADAAPVRVARLLDDVADRKHVHVYPAIRTGGLTLRPYYTVDNDLSIAVSRES